MLLFAAGAPVFAQQDTPPPEPAPAAEAAPPAAGDLIAGRIGRLEEQIHDLQVMVGTLTSLLKSKPDVVLPQESAAGDAAQGVSNAADLGARVDALETQIGALTSQLELMTQQLGAIEAKLGRAGAPQSLSPPGGEEPRPSKPMGRQGLAPADPSAAALTDAGGTVRDASLFGTRNVATAAKPAAPSRGEDVAAREPLPPATQDEGRQPRPDQPQSLAAMPAGSDAISLYNQGYGDLLRKDYPAAETSFRQLVKRYPDDPLAGKAQYWLGESYYVRGQFKDAADAFLKGYRKYKSSEKAPDSLLKLGMALAELGQKDAACTTFSEFSTRFPSAEEHLRDQAKGERRRVGC
ncbi:MAG: tol-pal system protein YbgF [Methyloceanibacter sp.]